MKGKRGGRKLNPSGLIVAGPFRGINHALFPFSLLLALPLLLTRNASIVLRQRDWLSRRWYFGLQLYAIVQG